MARASLIVALLGAVSAANAREQIEGAAVSESGLTRRHLNTAFVALNGKWERHILTYEQDLVVNITFCQFGQLHFESSDGTVLRDDAAAVDVVADRPTCLCDILYLADGKSNATLHPEIPLDECTNAKCLNVSGGSEGDSWRHRGYIAKSVATAVGIDNGNSFWATLMNIDSGPPGGSSINGINYRCVVSIDPNVAREEPNAARDMNQMLSMAGSNMGMDKIGNVTCPHSMNDDDGSTVMGDDDGSIIVDDDNSPPRNVTDGAVPLASLSVVGVSLISVLALAFGLTVEG